MTDEQAVIDMTRRTVLEYGGLDILVASAGLATSAAVTETSLDDWERNFAVLARGYFLAAREAFRVLLEQATRRIRRLRRLEERPGRRERMPRPTRRRRRRRSISGAVSPKKGDRTASASTPSTRTR